MPNDIANNMADTIHQFEKELKDLREENKVLISECDRLIKEKGELLKKSEQIAEYKRLLKAAVENMNDGGCTRSCSTCKYGRDGCKYTEGYEWIHTDESLKLIGGETDGQI